ncbi:hypothetical protein V8C37DRAFT_395026 [Trichoderma ceciliae]
MAPQPHLRHQSSLEGIIDFSQGPLLTSEQHAKAKRKFYQIVNHFINARCNHGQYNRPLLIRYTYEYALSEKSQNIFLNAFFQSIALSVDDENGLDFTNKEMVEELGSMFSNFSEYLMDNFFLPLKASTRKTPQPSPAFLSATIEAQGGNYLFLGTLDHVAALRGECLIRDRHRCVISRKFDLAEAALRDRKDGVDAQDDDGNAFPHGYNHYTHLEVAHILPHSLTEVERGSSELVLLSISNIIIK